MEAACRFMLTYVVEPEVSPLLNNSWPEECFSNDWAARFRNIPADASSPQSVMILS
jgi:hypothetical protein